MKGSNTFKESYARSAIPPHVRKSILRKFFPQGGRVELLESRAYQDKGIDFFVTVDGQRTLWEEKKRYKKYADDVFLEFVSIDNNGQSRQGYVPKLHNSDYLLYLWQSDNEALVIESKTLYAAWQRHMQIWLLRYPIKAAVTESEEVSYAYLGLAVPVKTLIEAGVKIVRINLDKPESER